MRQGMMEEGMLESLAWLHPGLGVVVQHLEDEGLELAVVLRGVARFSLSYPSWGPSLHSQDVIQGLTARTTVHIRASFRSAVSCRFTYRDIINWKVCVNVYMSSYLLLLTVNS